MYPKSIVQLKRPQGFECASSHPNLKHPLTAGFITCSTYLSTAHQRTRFFQQFLCVDTFGPKSSLSFPDSAPCCWRTHPPYGCQHSGCYCRPRSTSASAARSIGRHCRDRKRRASLPHQMRRPRWAASFVARDCSRAWPPRAAGPGQVSEGRREARWTRQAVGLGTARGWHWRGCACMQHEQAQ